MGLTSLFAANENLTFVDANTGSSRSIRELQNCLDLNTPRALAFVYNDNQLPAVTAFLNFYRSEHAVALLGNSQSAGFKENLENLYKPFYIFDPHRKHIEGYSLVKAEEGIELFQRMVKEVYPIHPKIKLLLSTSGTTGSPKFVRLSDENLTANASSILDYMPILSTDVVPLNVPIHFVYGLSIFTTNCMRAGKIVCTDKDVLQKEFWADFTNYGYSTLGGVPYFYEMLHRIGFFKKNHPSLRYLTHTGGMLNEKLIQDIDIFMREFGKDFIAQYGQTEAGGRMAYLAPEDLLRKAGSIGKPIKDGSFTIDPETQELLYSGPNVSGGYATSYTDLNDFTKNQHLHTGDRARIDEESYYYIIGRIKRIIKLFGTRINLDETELILKNTLAGKTIICIGLNDNKLGVLYQDEALSPDLIAKVLKAKLGIAGSATKIRHIENIPLTANSKVNYPLLKEMLDKQTLSAV